MSTCPHSLFSDVAMLLTISRALLDEIGAHAAETPEREVCGLLLGTDARVERVMRCANVAPDARRHFEVDPAALLAAHRAARGGGPRPIGHYHSHPSAEPIPSAYDAAMADPGSYWIIVTGTDIRCWWSRADGP